MAQSAYELIAAYDGALIRAARFEPDSKPLGVIQILHGFGEGIEHYNEAAEFFAQSGYACVIYDQRGFGKTADIRLPLLYVRGAAPDYDCFLEDIKTVRNKIGQWYPDIPVILFGFSLGGNIIVNYLLKYPQEQYEKVILESPWFRLLRPLPFIVELCAKLIGKISWKLTISSHFRADYLSRNMEKIYRLQSFNLFHDRISFRLLSQISEAGEYAIKNADRIKIPVLLLCANADKIVSPQAMREFSGRANGNVTLIEYPGGYHYLHLDAVSDEVLGTMLSFCMAA